MSHKYGNLSGPDEITIKPNSSVWVAWPKQERGWHSAGSARIDVTGTGTLTFECRTDGALTASYVMIDKKSGNTTGGGDHQDIGKGRALVTNVMKIGSGRWVGIRLSNTSNAPVAATKLQFRGHWCTS